MNDFRKELTDLINFYSKENGSDTPDFILAEYLGDCLQVFDKAINARDKWCMPDVEMDPDTGAEITMSLELNEE